MTATGEGSFAWWFNSLKQAIAAPGQYLKGRATQDSFGSGTIFFLFSILLTSLIGGGAFAIGGAMSASMLAAMPGITQSLLTGISFLIPVVMFVFGFIGGIIGLVIFSAILHVIYILIGGEGSFNQTYSMSIYSGGPQAVFTMAGTLLLMLIGARIGSAITGIASIAGMIYYFYLFINGMAIKHDFSRWAAAAPIFIFFIIGILGALV